MDTGRYNSTQIQFINTLIDYFTQNGVMNPNQLAQPPFSDIHSSSVFGLFNDADIKQISTQITVINQNAEASNDPVVFKQAADDRGSYGGK